MKLFTTGGSIRDCVEKNKEWKPFFAWYPVCLQDGSVVIFETVKRRAYVGTDFGGPCVDWEYKK